MNNTSNIETYLDNWLAKSKRIGKRINESIPQNIEERNKFLLKETVIKWFQDCEVYDIEKRYNYHFFKDICLFINMNNMSKDMVLVVYTHRLDGTPIPGPEIFDRIPKNNINTFNIRGTMERMNNTLCH